VSFEVQDYEGPDHDPLLNRGKTTSQKSGDVRPSKQHKLLQHALKNLSMSLLKMNAISFDQDIAN